jgi:hypothetical protein
MILHRFFWLFAFPMLGLALLSAFSLVPQVAPLLAPGGPVRMP